MRTLLALVTLLLVSPSLVPTVMAQSDTQPPQLVGMSFSPSSVDVTSSAQTVTFTVRLTDNLAGLSLGSIGLRSPSGLQNPSGSTGFVSPTGILDRTFNVPVQIQRYSEPGTWTVSSVFLSDQAGNFVVLNTAALAAAGFPTTFDVTDANPDTVAPGIGSVLMTPNSVNVSSSPATVTVDINFTDSLSGFSVGSSVSLLDFVITSASGQQSRYLNIRQWQMVSGTVNNGFWRASFDIPRYSEAGVWRVTSIRTRDATGNDRLFLAPDLAGFGQSIELLVASNPSDTTPPQLTGLAFTPAFINTSQAPQAVQTDVALMDDLSGVSFHRDTTLISNFRGILFRSPSGAQFNFTNATPSSTPVSGSPLNGTWRFNTNFVQFSEEGTWQVTAHFIDSAGNVLNLSQAQVAALGIPHSIDVIRPSLQPDGTISNPAAGGTVMDTAFGNRAQLIVPAGVLSAPTTIAIDVVQSPLSVPLPTGFSSAETYFVNVELNPPPSFPLPAPGITVVLPLRNYVIPGTAINLLRIDPATGSLVPALDVSGNPATGQVDPGGLTATFLGIARFSTLVGALRDAIQVAIDVRPGETPNTLNLKSKGTIPVAIFSTPTLDLTHVDPSTIRFSGAPVATSKNGKWQVSYVDVNDDGFVDVIARFETNLILLGSTDTAGVVEGFTQDSRVFRGTDSVRVIR